MISTTVPSPVRRHAMTTLSIAMVVIYGLFIEFFWGWSSVLAEWAMLGWDVALAAIMLLMLTYLIRTHRIADYFRPRIDGHFWQLYRLTQTHNLLNIMLPFRAGEASFPLLMRTQFGVTLPEATAALLVMRLFDLHALASVAFLGVVWQLTLSAPVEIVAFTLLAVFAALPLILAAFHHRFFHLAPDWLPARLAGFVSELRAGLPRNRAAFFRVWLLTLANWLIKVVIISWIFSAFSGQGLGPALGGALGGELSSVLPVHGPAGIGTYQGGIIAGALSLGAPTSEGMLRVLTHAAIHVHLLILVSAFMGAGLGLATHMSRSSEA